MTRPRVSVVIPAYNEGDEIMPVLDRVFEAVTLPCEVWSSSTPGRHHRAVPREYAEASPGSLALNTYGRGPANAIRFGIDAALAPVVVVTMADGCDDPQQIDDLARLVERGVVVAAASRYMPGGQQVGGPLLKGLMSRAAGLSLHWFARVGTQDATNSSRPTPAEFVQEVGIQSDAGFEIGHRAGGQGPRLRRPVAEIPTIWLDRTAGGLQLQGGAVAAPLPALVLPSAFGPQARPCRSSSRRTRRALT